MPRSRNAPAGIVFNIPMLLIVLMFLVLPAAGTFITGFYKNVTFAPSEFNGVENFNRMMGDGHFWDSFFFTAVFTFVTVILETVLGLAFALLLNEKMPGRGLLRGAMLIPWAVPMAVSARIWELIYNYDYGIINYALMWTGITGAPVSWFGTPETAFISIVISDVWKSTPFMTIILLSGLSVIPEAVYQQAKIDGAGLFTRFSKITLPLLKPILLAALIFRTIDAVRVFDLVYILTGGGPGGSTTSLSLYAYNYYVSGDFGYGSAVSVVLFLFTGTLAVFYIKAGGFGKEAE